MLKSFIPYHYIFVSQGKWLFLFMLGYMNVNAQHAISSYERQWAILHPFVALKIKKQLPQAMLIYKNIENEKRLDTLAFGGKLDAFRHSYTMAFFARTIKVKKLRSLGFAHEKGNKKGFYKQQLEFAERADSMACEMDLQNNEVGFRIGLSNIHATDEQLRDIILSEIKNGQMVYLKRNHLFNYVTCNKQIINMLDYKGVWSVPKCLIKTNE